MSTEWTVVIGMVCTIVGVVVGILGYKRSADRDAAAVSEREGGLLVELGYIKSGVDDIRREQREQAGRHNALTERVTRSEGRIEQALQRIDGIEKKCYPPT